MMPNKFYKVRVFNAKELEPLMMQNQKYAVQIAARCSKKTRKAIEERAQQMQVKLLNWSELIWIETLISCNFCLFEVFGSWVPNLMNFKFIIITFCKSWLKIIRDKKVSDACVCVCVCVRVCLGDLEFRNVLMEFFRLNWWLLQYWQLTCRCNPLANVKSHIRFVLSSFYCVIFFSNALAIFIQLDLYRKII